MAQAGERTYRITRPGAEALRLGIACTLAGWVLSLGVSWLPLWQALEYRVFDLLSISARPLGSNMPITIVGIDEASATQLGQRWPYPRDLHARLITNLKAAGAAVIAFDVQFSEPGTPEEDTRFAEAIAAAGNVVLASKFEYHETSSTRVFMRMDPITALTSAGASVGLTDMALANDQVPRRMATGTDAFWRVAVRKLVEVMPEAGITEPAVPEGAMIRYLGPRNTFPVVSYYQVINGEPDALALMDGALVLVGREAGATTEINVAQADVFPTPFTLSTGLLSSGVEIHATQVENALLGILIEPASRGQNLLFATVALLLVLPWTVWWHPLRSTAGVLACIGITGGAALLLFDRGFCDNGNWWSLFSTDCRANGGVQRQIWVSCAAPMAGMLAAFLGTGSGSFLTERRHAARIRSAFSLYVSGDVVQQMISHPEKLRLGGERREISVMFSDLSGFTEFSEKLDPDNVALVVNTYLNAMTQVIMRNGGTVDKFIGDAVMAFWGAPVDDAQHARHCMQAALEMQQAMEGLQPRFAELGAEGLSLRIGLNTGTAIVGNMGSDQRFDYTALGDTVNLASRLEGANKAYGTPILAAGAIEQEVRGIVPMRQVDRVRVKGKERHVDVFTPCSDPQLVALTQRAWQAYLAREWSEALSALEGVRAICAHDALAAMLQERVVLCAAQPPGPDWDGSVSLDKL